MKKLILFAIVIFTSCSPVDRQKPYVITGKVLHTGYATYYYQCRTCYETFRFEESVNAYRVGDTIK